MTAAALELAREILDGQKSIRIGAARYDERRLAAKIERALGLQDLVAGVLAARKQGLRVPEYRKPDAMAQYERAIGRLRVAADEALRVRTGASYKEPAGEVVDA